jgi:hypothetical protein
MGDTKVKHMWYKGVYVCVSYQPRLARMLNTRRRMLRTLEAPPTLEGREPSSTAISTFARKRERVYLCVCVCVCICE